MKVKTGIVSYGIIGAGMMGREHLLNIKALDGAAVVAIADPHLPSQEAALALLPTLKVQNWNRFNSNTGGTLVEKCCHFFDLMNLITGASPVRVMASGAQNVNHLDENYNGKVPDIIDNAYVIVEYDNGIRSMLDLCMFAEGGNNEQEICVVGDIGKGEAFVPESIVRYGTRTGGRGGVQTLEVHDDRIKYEGLHHGSSFLEHLEFLAAVRSHGGERLPMASLHDGLLSVAIGMAAQKSIEQGKPVSLRDILENNVC